MLLFIKKNLLNGYSKGFSLVEIIVATSILLVIATAIIPLFVFVAEGTQKNKAQLFASKLAHSRMEEIKMLLYEAFDSNGVLITDDHTVPQVGTFPGGNPFGSIPKVETFFDARGVEYSITTEIDWVNDPSSTGGPGIDFKRVRIKVEAPSVFTGSILLTEDIHSWVAKEGEERVFEAGHIHAYVRTLTGEYITGNFVEINKHDTSDSYWSFDESMTQYKNTGNDGLAVFGIIPAGDYKIVVGVPDNMMVNPSLLFDIDQSIVTVYQEDPPDPDIIYYRFPKVTDGDIDEVIGLVQDDLIKDPGPSAGLYIQKHSKVSNYSTKEEFFYDLFEKPSHIALEVRHLSDEIDLVSDNISLITLETPHRTIIKENITNNDGIIEKEIIGPLWPNILPEDTAYYFSNIKVDGHSFFSVRQKNSSAPESLGEVWPGKFTDADETVTLVIWVTDCKVIQFINADFDQPGQPAGLRPGVFIINEGFEHTTPLKATLNQSIVFINNSGDDVYNMVTNSSWDGKGVVYVKGDMYMNNNAEIKEEVTVFVAGNFSMHTGAKPNNKVVHGDDFTIEQYEAIKALHCPY